MFEELAAYLLWFGFCHGVERGLVLQKLGESLYDLVVGVGNGQLVDRVLQFALGLSEVIFV